MIRLLIATLLIASPAFINAQDSEQANMNQTETENTETRLEYGQIIYMFSGLGADSLAFQNLHLPGYKLVYVDWIPPQKSESLEHYASRIKSRITTPDPIVVGLSFGGMVAVEVAKQMRVRKLILISSAKTKHDLATGSFFLFKNLRLYKIIPGSLLKQTNFMVYALFGIKSEKDKKALTEILKSNDPHFFRWAMNNILSWKNETIPPHLIHIHGTSDKIIPYRAVKADYGIKGGGHFMVLNHADTISNIILDYLRK
ncbi:MAG: alpha/beta hydrolase [Taibaiella sp.]|jgi:pimeloyl-ACP methyl ester carboxylesterase